MDRVVNAHCICSFPHWLDEFSPTKKWVLSWSQRSFPVIFAAFFSLTAVRSCLPCRNHIDTICAEHRRQAVASMLYCS